MAGVCDHRPIHMLVVNRTFVPKIDRSMYVSELRSIASRYTSTVGFFSSHTGTHGARNQSFFVVLILSLRFNFSRKRTCMCMI